MHMVPGHRYYYEWRTEPDNVKVYEQRLKVGYADYQPQRWYVSVADLGPSWQSDDEL